MKLIIFGLIFLVEIMSVLSDLNASDIIGGAYATKNEWNMLVPILAKSPHIEPICGGTIISKNHILTAGHCVHELGQAVMLPTESIGVAYGVYHITKIETDDIHTPKKIIVHPNYKYEIIYDLSILEMDKIEFSEIVAPACIPTTFDFNDKKLDVMGWGLTKPGGQYSNRPKKTKVAVVDRSKCEETYAKHDFMDKTANYQICTLEESTGQCKRDSGGPLQWLNPNDQKWNLVGAVSFGFESCSEPNVITNIPFFYPWIKQTVEEGSSTLLEC